MATWQGILRVAGTPTGKIFYTGYYRNAAGGGSPGPGAGTRASQWCSGVYMSEASGQATLSLSSDNFLGAAATVANGDQLIVLAWSNSAVTPAEAAGAFLSGQSRTDGSGGTHSRGFKSNNGAAMNYADVDLFVAAVYTMTGQSWNATPGGTGGDANGDLTLLANAGPTAVVTGASTNPASPTAVVRNATIAIANGSADTQTSRNYSFNSQICFEQSSAAHNPGDATPTDGSVFSYGDGLTYGTSPGTPASSSHAGPTFQSTSHVFPHIDTYPVTLVTKDDNISPLTATTTVYYKTTFTTPGAPTFARYYCTWAQFLANPTSANASWGAGNSNTIRDVVKVTATFTDVDKTVTRYAGEARFLAAHTLDGSSAFVINQTGIGTGLPVSAPFGFLVVTTKAGADVRRVYEITAASADSITINTKGSTEAYTARDWFFTTGEPGGGTDTHFDWQVNTASAGWVKVGRAPAALTVGVSGTTISFPGVGQNACPGWFFRVIDGPARGSYRIASVTNDNEIVLATGMPAAAAGDTYELSCRDSDCFWPQQVNDTLDFRIVGTWTNGWPSSGTYTFESVYGTYTNTGSVGNIPPQAAVLAVNAAALATAYTFDGGRSYGTQTTWVQDSMLAAAHTLDGTAAFIFTDANLNTAGLRDGHAWLAVLDALSRITSVFPVVDLDLETPDYHTVAIDTKGSTVTWPAGTKFRTTNDYEIEGSNLDNDIMTYAWTLRSADSNPGQPTSHADFLAKFPRLDGGGAGQTWGYTYAQIDNGRWACIELVVTDPRSSTHTVWVVFEVVVTSSTPSTVPRRVEWE